MGRVSGGAAVQSQRETNVLGDRDGSAKRDHGVVPPCEVDPTHRHLARRCAVDPKVAGHRAEPGAVERPRTARLDPLGQVAGIEHAVHVGSAGDSPAVGWTRHLDVEQGGIHGDRVGAGEQGQRGEIATPARDAESVRSTASERESPTSIERRDVGAEDQRVHIDSAGDGSKREVHLLEPHVTDPAGPGHGPTQGDETAAVGDGIQSEPALEAPLGAGIPGPAGEVLQANVPIAPDPRPGGGDGTGHLGTNGRVFALQPRLALERPTVQPQCHPPARQLGLVDPRRQQLQIQFRSQAVHAAAGQRAGEAGGDGGAQAVAPEQNAQIERVGAAGPDQIAGRGVEWPALTGERERAAIGADRRVIGQAISRQARHDVATGDADRPEPGGSQPEARVDRLRRLAPTPAAGRHERDRASVGGLAHQSAHVDAVQRRATDDEGGDRVEGSGGGIDCEPSSL